MKRPRVTRWPSDVDPAKPRNRTEVGTLTMRLLGFVGVGGWCPLSNPPIYGIRMRNRTSRTIIFDFIAKSFHFSVIITAIRRINL